MSLSSFIELPDVKKRLRLDVTKPWFQVDGEMKAPPLTDSYGLTGTAFDYLLRFYVEKLNPPARRSHWVAEASLELLEQRMPKATAVLKEARSIVGMARKYHAAYLKRKGRHKPGWQLIWAAIGLARLDLVFRAALVDLRPPKDGVVQDLVNLLSLVRPEDFTGKRVCILNPTFGSASELVGGADADLFIDGTLIDIKTSKHLEMRRDIFNQLLGYYCLSCLGGVEGCRSKVNAVAIYYARYGILHRIPISSFVNPRRFPSLISWFKARARNEFGGLKAVLNALP